MQPIYDYITMIVVLEAHLLLALKVALLAVAANVILSNLSVGQSEAVAASQLEPIISLFSTAVTVMAKWFYIFNQ